MSLKLNYSIIVIGPEMQPSGGKATAKARLTAKASIKCFGDQIFLSMGQPSTFMLSADPALPTANILTLFDSFFIVRLKGYFFHEAFANSPLPPSCRANLSITYSYFCGFHTLFCIKMICLWSSSLREPLEAATGSDLYFYPQFLVCTS